MQDSRRFYLLVTGVSPHGVDGTKRASAGRMARDIAGPALVDPILHPGDRLGSHGLEAHLGGQELLHPDQRLA